MYGSAVARDSDTNCLTQQDTTRSPLGAPSQNCEMVGHTLYTSLSPGAKRTAARNVLPALSRRWTSFDSNAAL